jgi:cyclopropane-fatty-acyl-phospholipid synthase
LEVDYKGIHKFGKGFKVKIKVLNPRFFRRIILYGEIGLGESYFLSEFETDDLYKLLEWFIINKDKLPVSYSPMFTIEWGKIIGQIDHYLNKNTRKGSKRNIESHYDLSNKFYKLWLDDTMTYSCAIFEKGMNLKQAQLNKYKRICEKLELKKQDHILEIGTGWGGFAEYVKKNYGNKITTITISKKQFDFAKQRLKDVDLRLCDYRDINGKYDKIVSIEMMEALGHEYVSVFIRKCNDLFLFGFNTPMLCIDFYSQIRND